MTTRLATAAVLILLLSTACSAAARSGPAPAADFTATISREEGHLHITYEFVNRSGEDVAVLNRAPAAPLTPDPNAVDIVADGPPGRVQIGKRAFARPELGNAVTEPYVSGTIISSGQSVAEDITVPLPLRLVFPYGGETDALQLPDPVKEVVFCVGVIRRRDLPPSTVDGNIATVAEESSTTAVQRLYCSDPYGM